MTKSCYTYSLISYVHDAFSEERLNIGVVVNDSDGRMEFRAPSSLARVESTFPGASVSAIRHSLLELKDRVCEVLQKTGDLAEALSMALPDDEGGLRASRIGVGLGGDLTEVADALLERFVLKCEWGFGGAQVMQNRDRPVEWHSIGPDVRFQDSSNDEMFLQAQPQSLRACH